MKGITEFIREIQISDDATKRKWLVIFSGSTMLVVVAVWVMWMGAVIPGAGLEAVAKAEPERPGVFKTLAAGVSVIWSDIESRLLRRETWSVEENRNFIADDLPIIPPTPLP